MADPIDPNEAEARRNATEATEQLAAAINNTAAQQERQTKILLRMAEAQGVNVRGLTDTTVSLGRYRGATDAQTRAAIENTQAAKKHAEAMQNFSKSAESFGSALGAATKALLATEKSFTKYGDSVDKVGDGLLTLGKNFGIVGTALGLAAKAATTVFSAGMKQADASLKATDDLSKMGAAGTFTAKEVLTMGHNAGLTSKNLEAFTKAAKSLGTATISLGSTVGDGVTEFSKMTAVSKEQRMAFQRLGIGQDELLQSQADYVTLQKVSGVQITARMKQDDGLKKASLEYTRNLLELSAITGEDIEGSKKLKIAAQSEYETMVQTNMMQQKINKLQAEGTADSEAQAEVLKKELKARNDMLEVAASTKDQGIKSATAQFLATGAITEQSVVLKRLIPNIEEFGERVKKGEDVSVDFANALRKGIDANAENLGTAAMLNKAVGNTFGMSKEMFEWTAQRRAVDLQAAKDAAAKGIVAPDQGVTGEKTAEDPAQKARNALTETEIKAQVELDKLLLKFNPLMNGFDGASTAATGLAAALGVATLALVTMAGVKGIGAITDIIKGLSGKAKVNAPDANPASIKSTGAADRLSRLGRFAGPAAGVVSSGLAAYGAYQGYQDAEDRVKSGELTKAEGTVKKSEAVGGGVGGVAGGVGGAWAGAATGATIGAVGGPLGIAIGGVIGAAVGGWLGSKGGELVGEKVGTVAGKALAGSPEDKLKLADSTTAQEKLAEVTTDSSNRLIQALNAARISIDKLTVTNTKISGVTEGAATITPTESSGVKSNLASIEKELRGRGETDESYIKSVLANVMKESGGVAKTENLDYGKTSIESIRSKFGERVAGKTDKELTQIKSDPSQMGEMVYGKDTKIGQQMGNLEPGDGFLYRGRGYIQLTGKANYAKASQAIFGDDRLVKNPDIVNVPSVSAMVTAWYMQQSKAPMAKLLGMDTTQKFSKEQADLLATSQVAGQAITPGQGYLGTESLGKVSQMSGQLSSQSTGKAATTAKTTSPTKAATVKTAGGGRGFYGVPEAIAAEQSDKVEELFSFGGPTGSKSNFDQLDPNFKDNLIKAAQAYIDAGGKKITLTSAFRDQEDQERLYKSWKAAGGSKDNPTAAGITTPAKPISMGGKLNAHGAGFAIDAGQQAADMNSKINLADYGLEWGGKFSRPDPVHIQLAGFNPQAPADSKISASLEGIAEGPESGYAATLHGNELIKRLQKGSILDELANTPAVAMTAATNDGTTDMLADIKEMMEDKLNDLIDAIKDGNDISDKLLKSSRV